MDPLVFGTYCRPQVWGGRQLTELGKALPAGTYGEAWEISAHPHHVSSVAEGPLGGATLAQLWARHARELYGTHREPPPRFPLLVKFLDCHELLSVQVHPNDAVAAELFGDELGKTEAWVVLAAEPTARIYAGLKQGVTRRDLESHLAAGTVADCLHTLVPKAGDCIFLPAGTVHAVGGGVLLAEVQQSSDATLRLFDWDRPGPDGKPRQLHVAQALDAIDFSIGPIRVCHAEPLPGLPAGVAGEELVRCRHFELVRFRPAATFRQPYVGQLSIWLVLDGAAHLTSQSTGYGRTFMRGETVLVPASAAPLDWEPMPGKTSPTLLGVHVP
jgi:mannose-6-phosphate isomerase